MPLILSKHDLIPNTKEFVIAAPSISQKAEAGQFVVLRLSGKGERIPISIASADPEKGTITLVVQEIGYTTAKMCLLTEGDNIPDIAGPLGRMMKIKKAGTIAGIGGGFGIAALYPVLRAYKKAGNYTIAILGARSQDLLFWEDKIRAVSNELYITTNDGSRGRKGLVTYALRDIIENGTVINEVFAVGPVPMMKASAEVTRPFNIKTTVSLNPVMIDGTGMCGCCRVSVGGKTYFACVDGPDFDAHKVNFDLLAQRQRMYKEQEKKIYGH